MGPVPGVNPPPPYRGVVVPGDGGGKLGVEPGVVVPTEVPGPPVPPAVLEIAKSKTLDRQ